MKNWKKQVNIKLRSGSLRLFLSASTVPVLYFMVNFFFFPYISFRPSLFLLISISCTSAMHFNDFPWQPCRYQKPLVSPLWSLFLSSINKYNSFSLSLWSKYFSPLTILIDHQFIGVLKTGYWPEPEDVAVVLLIRLLILLTFVAGSVCWWFMPICWSVPDGLIVALKLSHLARVSQVLLGVCSEYG